MGTTTDGTTTTEVAPDSSLAGSTSTPPADILLANGLSDEILIGIQIKEKSNNKVGLKALGVDH